MVTSDAEKLQSIINKIYAATQEGSITNYMVAEALQIIDNVKQNSDAGKGLSTEDFTEELKEKLATLQNAPADWGGTQTEFNSLTEYDSGRWYFILANEKPIAAYRGSVLVWAKPNCVGRFADDSTADDWYWWPDGVKTALPVDPVTKRFAFYYPGTLSTAAYLFSGGSGANAFDNTALTRLESVPPCENMYAMLYTLKNADVYPVLDCSAVALQYGQYRALNYVLPNTSKRPHDIYFRGTEQITDFEMVINNTSDANPDYWPTRVFGLDLTGAQTISGWAFGGSTCLIQAVNLGKCPALSSADLRSVYWGNDSLSRGARQSVVDTLLTYSFDRVSAGYDPVSVILSEYTAGALTEAEKTAISAKGYTLVTQ